MMFSVCGGLLAVYVELKVHALKKIRHGQESGSALEARPLACEHEKCRINKGN